MYGVQTVSYTHLDDEALIRSGLRARIAFFNFPDLDVDEAGSGAEALRRFGESEYGIAIVDISMPDMNGLEPVSYTHLDVYKRQKEARAFGTLA